MMKSQISEAGRRMRIWICAECAKPINDGEGYVKIDNADSGRSSRPVHSECDETGYHTYHIDVERIRTDAQALDWTRHLLGKVWFGAAEAREFLDLCLGRHESQRARRDAP